MKLLHPTVCHVAVGPSQRTELTFYHRFTLQRILNTDALLRIHMTSPSRVRNTKCTAPYFASFPKHTKLALTAVQRVTFLSSWILIRASQGKTMTYGLQSGPPAMVRPSSGTSSQRQSRAVSYGLAFACNRALAGCMQSGSKTYHNTTRWTIRPRFTGYPPRVLLLQLEQVAVYKLLGLCPLHVVWNIERPSI